MRRSPEIEAVVRRLVAARYASDVDTVRALHSRSQDLRSIGSDEDEWYRGFDDVAGILEKHAGEATYAGHELVRLEAFERGEVGWAAGEVTVALPAGESFLQRFTLVLALEGGTWRVVQTHYSLPVPNEQVLGYELTTTLSDMLRSIEREPADSVARNIASGTETVMFTDIKDSTEISQRLGDDGWSALVRSHFETLGRIVEAEGGRVVKTLGDGGMYVFGSARAGLCAAVRIQQAVSASQDDTGISVRIGVHSGDVLHTEGDYLGSMVNKAARITAAADGGEIMVSNVAAELAGTSVLEFGDPITAELKGLKGTHQLMPLHWQHSRET